MLWRRQHVTQEMFTALIKSQYRIGKSTTTTISTELTCEEENVVRYIAGYVCRRLREKLEPPRRQVLQTTMHSFFVCLK